MAKADYTVADRPDAGKTASERLDETTQVSPDAESWERAHAAGVSHPAYVGYAAALETLQTREDIETLASRRARTYGADFNDADYMRLVPGQPGPGSVYGQAPKSATDPAVVGGRGADVYGLEAAADRDDDGIPNSTDPTPDGGV